LTHQIFKTIIVNYVKIIIFEQVIFNEGTQGN